jgi:uncharacterized iron-regulated membrane protein
MKFRNRLLTLHGFVGILGGILLAIMGLTGSAIVFHQELDHALNPQLMKVIPQGTPVSIDAVLQSVQSHLPKNSRLESIRIPRTPEETYQLGLKAKPDTLSEMFIHPYTGEFLGVRQSKQTIISMLYAIHHDLFAGTLGLYLVGLSGLILIAQAITGLILWTGWRKLASGVRIRWRAPIRLLSFDLHNVGGFVSNLFLLITGFTGVIIVGAHILLAPPAEAEVPPPFQNAIAVSKLLRKADAAIPEGTIMDVSFLDAQKMVVTKRLPQDHARFYFSSVTLDGRTGKVLELNKVTETPPMWKFLIPVADLHFGTFGGLPTRILYVFVGLVPTVLFVTGLLNWRRRRSLGARRELAIIQTQQPQETSVF